MTATFTIEGRMPGLNEYTRKERGNKYQGAAMKRRETERAAWAAKAAHVPAFTEPVAVIIEWHEPNRRRDLDNVASAKKFILDGLVRAGVLANDDQRHVIGFTDTFHIDRERPRIVVSIIEPDRGA